MPPCTPGFSLLGQTDPLPGTLEVGRVDWVRIHTPWRGVSDFSHCPIGDISGLGQGMGEAKSLINAKGTRLGFPVCHQQAVRLRASNSPMLVPGPQPQ